MTREEATIQSLMGHIEALEETIKTLKREPCGDCISRTEAMRTITDEWVRGKHTLEGFTAVLYNLPPVIPEQPVMTGHFITGQEPTSEWISKRTQAESEGAE